MRIIVAVLPLPVACTTSRRALPYAVGRARKLTVSWYGCSRGAPAAHSAGASSAGGITRLLGSGLGFGLGFGFGLGGGWGWGWG